MASIVDTLHREFTALLTYLQNEGEVTFQTTAEDSFRKALLLSAASYFETMLMEKLTAFFRKKSQDTDVVISFIQNRALKRQYHALFTWDAKNANSFFGLFGDGFKRYIQAELKNNSELEESIIAFLELGNDRNLLVHQNFATYPLTKTADEIHGLYLKALYFVENIDSLLDGYIVLQTEQVNADQNN